MADNKDTNTRISLISDQGERRIQMIKDVEVPMKYNRRIKMGIPVLDEIFGGSDNPGMFQGETVFLTGHPGGGKSTFALQASDALQKNAGLSVLVNSTEEVVQMIKKRADRIGLSDSEFSVSAEEDINSLMRLCEENGIEVLIVDSAQTVYDGQFTGSAGLKRVFKKLHKWAHETGTILFMVGHVNKKGQFAGPQELKHVLDAHVHLSINFDTGTRVLQLEKNRFGPAFVPYEMAMTPDRGLDFSNVTIVDKENMPGAGNGVTKIAERREELTKFIMQKLREGEYISGYCFERFDKECSGNFWRILTERAEKEMKGKGWVIAHTKTPPSNSGLRSGRDYIYIDIDNSNPSAEELALIDSPPEEKPESTIVVSENDVEAIDDDSSSSPEN